MQNIIHQLMYIFLIFFICQMLFVYLTLTSNFSWNLLYISIVILLTIFFNNEFSDKQHR